MGGFLGIGDYVSQFFGSKNKERAKGYNVDPNAYQYGGAPGGAETAANAYQSQGQTAQGRAAPQASTVNINYAQANQDRAQNQQARQGQNTLANIMSQRAQGLAGPSIAQQQADRQMQQAASQQAALAGSARGAGGLAAASRNMAFNTANAASDISGQAQINAANERRDDTNAAASMYGAMRGGDLAGQGQDAGQSQAQAQLAAQQNQFNAGLRDAQAGRNDQMTMGYEGLAQQTRLAQLGAQQNQQAQQSANTMGAQGINAGVGGQNASMNQANAMNVVSMAKQGAGIGAGAIASKAVGGPVGEAKPYLVGEKGPELVVPRKDGYVLTNEQTRAALAGSPASTINHLFDRGDQEARNVTMASIMGARCGGGPMQARALGGPVDAGGAGAQPMLGVGQPAPPSLSTWGTGDASGAQVPQWDPSALDALQQQIDAQQLESRKNTYAARQDVANIDQRDKDAIWNADYKDRHGQQLTKAEQDAESEARYRQDLDKKDARDKAKMARKRSVADVLSDSGASDEKAAAGIDTAYHGGGGHYVPPQLIPIAGARAMGGPMVAGGLVPLGPQMGPGGGVGGGIEYGGGGITGDQMRAAGTGLAGPQAVPGMVGGDGITGGASIGGHAIPGFGGAREDGGPIEGAKTEENDTRKLLWGNPSGDPKPPPKKVYNYDASRPFGERFVEAPPAYTPSTEVRRMDPGTVEHSQRLADEMGLGPDAARPSVPWEDPPKPEAKPAEDEHKSAANEILQRAALQTLLAGAGVGAPTAAAGIAHLVNSLFSRRGK